MSVEGNPAVLEGKNIMPPLSLRHKLNKTLFSGAKSCIGLTLETQCACDGREAAAGG